MCVPPTAHVRMSRCVTLPLCTIPSQHRRWEGETARQHHVCAGDGASGAREAEPLPVRAFHTSLMPPPPLPSSARLGEDSAVRLHRGASLAHAAASGGRALGAEWPATRGGCPTATHMASV
jgi:hypothetical protein